MCLVTNKIWNNRFKKEYGKDDTILVWKVYIKDKLGLTSPYRNEVVDSHGVVPSDRVSKRIHMNSGDWKPSLSEYWSVYHGIHVFTERKRALHFAKSFSPKCVVVCCHTKMSDLVAVSGYDEAVFMKISISPRNFRRAITGK